MATVRISTNWRHPDRMEWAGVVELDKNGVLARQANIPEEAYARIEAGLAAGNIEGDVIVADDVRVQWLLDR